MLAQKLFDKNYSKSISYNIQKTSFIFKTPSWHQDDIFYQLYLVYTSTCKILFFKYSLDLIQVSADEKHLLEEANLIELN